jgi:hypothetical protein
MSQTDPFREALLARLAGRGWHRVAHEHDSWRWGAEVWQLVSLARPRGLTAHLGFERDYVFEAERGLDSPRPVFRVYLAEEREELFAHRRLALEVAQPPWPREVLPIADALDHYRRDRAGRLDLPLPSGALYSEVLEAEWRAATDAEDLLKVLHGRLSDRKFRLFACACCRRLPHVLADPRNVRAIEAAERYADGLVPKRDLKKARKAADLPWLDSFEPYDEAVLAVRATLRATLPAGRGHLVGLLHDLSGNPFRPVPVKPSWLRHHGGTVAHLARVLYDEGRFEDLPVLADALEDAGCTSAAVLDHCRQPGRHARGCWLVDALLGAT